MFIVLLKIKDKIYFESLDTENEMIDYIEAIEQKFGDINYKESSIINGNKKNISTIMDMIEDEFYDYIIGRKLDTKIYTELLKMIENSKIPVKIKYGVEFEEDTIDEDIDHEIHESNTLSSETLLDIIETIETDEQHTIDFFIYPDEILIGLNLEAIGRGDYLMNKSFRQYFENIDEAISLFEGFKHDFMELIETETDVSFRIITMIDEVSNYIETKIDLMDWKETQIIQYLDGTYKKSNDILNSVAVYNHDDFLTAKEVMRMLRISDQTLANWRKNNLIKFRKISNRKFLYFMDSVQDIFENGIDSTGVVTTEKPINQPTKINYELEIIKMLKPIAYKIPEYKREKQNYFLNFGNIGIVSSPQVMINNNFQLVDFIKKSVIKDGSKELYEYLISIFKEGKQPRLDTSKRIQPEFSKFYLNKLFNTDV